MIQATRQRSTPTAITKRAPRRLLRHYSSGFQHTGRGQVAADNDAENDQFDRAFFRKSGCALCERASASDDHAIIPGAHIVRVRMCTSEYAILCMNRFICTTIVSAAQ